MKMHNPPHIGEIIIEALNESGKDITIISNLLAVDPIYMQQLISGQIEVTTELAIKLSLILGSSPQFWLNIQNNYTKNTPQ
ncbi:HigA family addiction module antidote protein [Providencia rettgeri]|nr:HigA family addiction module antidote protein [Providencia rettgeri]